MPTMTLNLDQRHMDVLDALAAEQDMSKTAVMRQALRVYQLVHQRAKDGQQLAFTKDGRTVVMELIGPMARPDPADACGVLDTSK